jgi:Protein of unknown function (DUF3352)
MNNVRSFALLLVLLVALAAGCGEDAASGPEGASVAPASAQLFVSIDSDAGSGQWKQAGALLDKFPGGDKLIASALGELSKEGLDFQQDVEPALGPETDIVGLDLSGEGEFVGLTQPDDAQKLKDLLAKGDQPLVSRDIDGWTAFAETDAVLDKFDAARQEGTLADASDYQDAISEVNPDGLVQLYLNGSGLAEAIAKEQGTSASQFDTFFPGGKIPSFAVSVTAEENGARIEGASTSTDESIFSTDNFEAELPDQVPGGVLFYANGKDLEQAFSRARDVLAEQDPQFDQDLARLEAQIGVSLDEDVFPLFSGETALYVRPSLLIPEVTLITDVDDEDAAMATVNKLATAIGQYVPAAQRVIDVDISGVQAKQMPLSGPVSLYWAAFDGHLVLTTSRAGIADLKSGDNRLADDEGFKSALEQAGMPDETTGFVYVNLHDAISSMLGLAGANVPPDVRANLEPLDSLVFYSSKDGKTLRFAGFLSVD